MEESEENQKYHIEEYKKCRMCAEDIKTKALKCRHCGSIVANEKIGDGGNFTTIILRAKEATYQGDIYLTDLKFRVSDIMNDDRKYISINNATREVGDKVVNVGFIMINKSIINWIREGREMAERVTTLF